MPSSDASRAPRVGLFVTCLVDAIRPRVGFAAIQLLEEAGCAVEVPMTQTCCGQPAWNSGDSRDAAASRPAGDRGLRALRLRRRALPAPAPAWSACTTPRRWRAIRRGRSARGRLAAKTYEITSFLADVRATGRRARRSAPRPPTTTVCAGLRELGVFAQPRKLLAAIDGLEMRKLEGNEECCGFGGTFCVKYPAISNAIVGEKAAAIERTGADLLLAGDLGCLMNMAGKLSRRGSRVRCFHTIEVLAGMADGPAIGEEG